LADPVVDHDPGERGAFRYMDAFRFVAALTVVLNHARDMVWIDYAGTPPVWAQALYFISGLGHEAVMVFFVLSGFWITHSAERKIGSAAFWPNYLTDRLSRLLIVIVPALLLGGLMDLAGAGYFHAPLYFGDTGAHSAPNDVYRNLTAAALFGNLLFVQSLLVPAFGSNGPLWSLAYELWYYLWFAALALAFRKRPSIALVTLALGLIWPRLLAGFLVWLIGSGLYYADRRWLAGRAPMAARWAGAILVVGCALVLAALATARSRILPGELSDLLVGMAFGVLVWGLLRGGARFPRRLLTRVSNYGAGTSFSLYALHYPLLAFALAAVGQRQRVSPTLSSFAVIVALAVLAVATAWLFSQVTEANTGRLRAAVKRRLIR
jgi:peptidoglycan/LPS O-acetylase OafA/YrhL